MQKNRKFCADGIRQPPGERTSLTHRFCLWEGAGRIVALDALSELQRRMKPLGATHMTGGGNPFYEKLGFEPCVGWTFWEKDLD